MASRDTVSPADQAAPTYDYHDAATVADLFDRAAEANLRAGLRRGATVHLPDRGRLIMTGDLHDHAVNLQRILNYARLERHPERHLVLHEIVHGRTRINGRDFSVRTLARVAALKLQFPEQVHLLQANHELAQLGGEGILKDGVSVVECFDEGVDYIYRDDAPRVRAAMVRFIRSLLLAIKCPNGIFCSHSLPSPRKLATFDETVIDRVPTDEDLSIGGSAYDMVWGRNHTRVVAEELGDAWGVKLFLMGHQPAEMGYEVEAEALLILASDHERGVALPIELNRSYDLKGLVDKLVPLASVKLSRTMMRPRVGPGLPFPAGGRGGIIGMRHIGETRRTTMRAGAIKGTLAAAVVGAALVGCRTSEGDRGGHDHAAAPQKHASMWESVNEAVAVIHPTEGNHIRGTVRFSKAGKRARVVADIQGLQPNGTHGFHIHEFGDCTAADAASAGGHYNPQGHPHAGPDRSPRHAGDLGNLQADAQGNAHLELTVDNITIADLKNPVIGRAVIVHAKADDLKSQPTGDAGGRIGCGVIGVAQRKP